MTVAISYVSALEKLVDDTKAFFDVWGVQADVSIGWKPRTRQDNQGPGGANRVVFTPGDPDAQGDAGEMVGAESPGMHDVKDDDGNLVARWRPIRTWAETVVVSVWALDPNAPDDERKQYAAVCALRDHVMRAAQWSQAQQIDWGKTRWTATPVELRKGAELRLWMTLRSPVPDVPEEVAFPANQRITPKLTTLKAAV